MSLLITCGNCQQQLQVPDEFVGKLLRCPACKNEVTTGPSPRAESIAADPQPEPPPFPGPADERPEDDLDIDRRRYPRSPRGPRRYRRMPEKQPMPPLVKAFIVIAVLGGVGVMVLMCAGITMDGAGPRPNVVFAPVRQAPFAVPNPPINGRLDDLLFQRSEVERQRGDNLRHNGQMDEAAVAYRTALDIDPRNADAFFGLVQALRPNENRDELAARFVKLDIPQQNFDIIAQNCQQMRDADGLIQLATAMLRIDPNYTPAEYYLMLAKAWNNQPDEAALLFKKIWPKMLGENKRSEYLAGFMQAMGSSGHAYQAYAAHPTDPREAFRLLAEELKRSHYPDELRLLLKVHAKKHADDQLLPFYEGDLHAMDGNYKLAEKAFAKGMANPPAPAVLEPFRYNRVLARYHAGQVLSAYADIGPPDVAFSQLTNLCWQDQKFADLAALLKEHAKIDPGNRQLLRFQYRLKLRDKQTDQAITLFKSVLAKEPDANTRNTLTADFLMEMVDAGKIVEGYRAAPAAREALQILGEDLLDQNRPKDLKALLAVHRQRQPDDIWTNFYQAELAMTNQAWDEVARELESAWAKAPKEFHDRARWLYIQALYKTGRGLDAQKKFTPHDIVFEQLANYYLTDRKANDLLLLVQTFRTQAGESFLTLSYEARQRLLLKNPTEATALFQRACEHQSDRYKRQALITSFVLAMEELGQWLEGYRACTEKDRAMAFRTLANQFVMMKKDRLLEALLVERVRHLPADAWTLSFEGDLHLLRGQFALAESKFSAALAKSPNLDRWTFRNGLNRARIKAGKAVIAYQELGPGTRNFEDLANLCVQEKNAEQLRALLGVHRFAIPDDPHAAAWELDVGWLAKDYEGVLKLLEVNRADWLKQSRYRWKAGIYLVRCLARLKRSDKAIEEAEALLKARQINAVMVVLAHASTGDAKKAIAAVERQQDRYLVEDCYRDDELGPLLRSEPFAEFRARYPEPKLAVQP